MNEFDRNGFFESNNCSEVIIMAVIFKNVLIEEKTEEKQHILSIINGEYDLSDDVSCRLR